MPNTKPSARDPIELGAGQLIDLTIAANDLAANDADVNAYEVRNALLLKRRKERIRYQNGYTLPASAELLLANAQKDSYNHRRTLARNIDKIAATPRPENVCAHHIVARADREAERARRRLFGWGIGINDGDNGVYLPMHSVGMPGFPDATHHSPYHSPGYHLAVYMRLLQEQEAEGGRQELRSIKADLLAGKMSL